MGLTADLVIGYLIHAILRQRNLAPQRALLYTCMWLFHPFSLNMSSRGSADSVVGALSLAAMYFVLARECQPILAGIMYGMAVHMKPYPVVFALSYWLWLGEGAAGDGGGGEEGEKPTAPMHSVCNPLARCVGAFRWCWRLLWTARHPSGWVSRCKFALSSGATLASFTGVSISHCHPPPFSSPHLPSSPFLPPPPPSLPPLQWPPSHTHHTGKLLRLRLRVPPRVPPVSHHPSRHTAQLLAVLVPALPKRHGIDSCARRGG
jgi:hypothetical protein